MIYNTIEYNNGHFGCTFQILIMGAKEGDNGVKARIGH